MKTRKMSKNQRLQSKKQLGIFRQSDNYYIVNGFFAVFCGRKKDELFIKSGDFS